RLDEQKGLRGRQVGPASYHRVGRVTKRQGDSSLPGRGSPPCGCCCCRREGCRQARVPSHQLRRQHPLWKESTSSWLRGSFLVRDSYSIQRRLVLISSLL